ncbi:MAG: hypothetical protein ABIP75_03060 [Pyrinomonadaceae bacterium]
MKKRMIEMNNENKLIAKFRMLALLALVVIAVPLATQAQTRDKGASLEPTGTIVEIVSSANAVSGASLTNGAQPFEVSANITQQPQTNVSVVNIATVPQGKRFVIEFVSFFSQLPTGQRVVDWKLTPATVSHSLLITQQPDGITGAAIFRANQELRLYAPPFGQIQVQISRSSNQGTGLFTVSISGYLEDAL